MARRKRDTVSEAVLELGSDEAVTNPDELDGQLAAQWNKRPVDHVDPVIFIDCIVVKIRDGQVANRPIYTVIGVSVDG